MERVEREIHRCLRCRRPIVPGSGSMYYCSQFCLDAHRLRRAVLMRRQSAAVVLRRGLSGGRT
jgi:hypothetical protein